MVDFAMLAEQAAPKNDADWGSDRQINAANDFFNAVENMISAEDFAALEAFCMKATAEEGIAEAMRVLQMQGKA